MHTHDVIIFYYQSAPNETNEYNNFQVLVPPAREVLVMEMTQLKTRKAIFYKTPPRGSDHPQPLDCSCPPTLFLAKERNEDNPVVIYCI